MAYDRRGFGRSDKPLNGYSCDDFTADLHTLINALHLDDGALVGFSMGGGEVARYIASFGEDRLHSAASSAEHGRRQSLANCT